MLQKEHFILIGTAIFTLFLCCSFLTGYAQNPNTNYITQSAFNAITYNGHTIAEINATEGETTDIHQFFGSSDSVKEKAGMDRRTFYYGANSFTYYLLNENITALSIKDSSWPVVIKGHTVKVGDTISELKQSFGSDLKTINSEYVSETVVLFNYQGNGIDGLHIYIDPNTQKITKIKYWVST